MSQDVPKQLEHGLKDELVPLPSCCIHTKLFARATGVVSDTRADGCIVLMLQICFAKWDSLIHIVLYSQDEGEEQFGSPAVFNHDTAVSC